MHITMSGLLRILPRVFVEFVPLCESANHARATANMLRALVDALLNCIAAELSGIFTSVIGIGDAAVVSIGMGEATCIGYRRGKRIVSFSGSSGSSGSNGFRGGDARDAVIAKLTRNAAKAVNMIAKYAPRLLFYEVDCRRHGLERLSTSVMHVLCAANSAGKRICNTTPVVCLAAARKAFDEARIQEKCTPLASPDQLFRFSTWGILAMWPQWGVMLSNDVEDGAGSDGAGSDGAVSDGAGNDGAGNDGAGNDGAGNEPNEESKAAERVTHAAWRRSVFRDLVFHAPWALADSGVSEQVFIENCAREAKAKVADATRQVREVVHMLQLAGR